MRRAGWALGLAGLVAAIAVIAYFGGPDVLSALALAGWGIAVVAVYHVSVILLDILAWRHLFRPGAAPPFRDLSWIRWVGISVNWLLPVAQLGGEFVRARLLTHRGVGGAAAGASVVVDMTVGVFTQTIFSVLGVAALVLVVEGAASRNLAGNLGLGLGVFSLLLIGFYGAQRYGLFLALARALEKIAGGREFMRLVGGAEALDREIVEIYRRPWPVFWSSLWRLGGWTAGAGEIWIAMQFLGHPIGFVEAFMLESLIMAARGAAFFVPGGLGVQEGGLVVLGALIGVPPDTALALSLIKRVREIVLGLPGLAVWQMAESRRFLRRRTETFERGRRE